jgi:ABC-2 type transport system ATP-binding protein
MKQNIISVKNVTKSFKKKEVLKGVNLEVEQGSIYALLGSNGAGKTTLIKIMTTLLKADTGQVRIGGFDTLKESMNARRQFSLTGQFAATDEGLTGRQNLQIIGELYHLDNVKDKAEELLKQFDLEDASDKLVSTYSGGMRRRLDIAMSLISLPDILFLDEPTTGLDPQNRGAMWDLVKSLSEAGTTIFLTTQYLEEAEVLADRIGILNEGVIVKEGTAKELKNILPGGTIEFSFYKYKDLKKAKEILKTYELIEDTENLSLTVMADDGIEQLTNILNLIQEKSITVANFTQKLPTLEDVFFALIKETTNNQDIIEEKRGA